VSEIASRQKGIIPPTVDLNSADYWDGLKRNVISLPRCNDCGIIWFPPTPGCPECGSASFERVEARQTGRIYSWVVVRRSLHPEFAQELPYVVATVVLDDGPKFFARLFDIEIDKIVADMTVAAEFYTVGEYTLLGFRPEDSSTAN
jgi:uncharacterized OB-fold protein